MKNLKRPPPPPPDNNHIRALKKAVEGERRSGTTSSDKRLQERRSANKIPQLGEQANQSCPPLKVSSDIVTNLPGMVPGTNPADYLPDDVHFDTMEVDEHKYQYGKPLVRPGDPPLTTMMRRFHKWYMDTCKSGKDILTLRVKEEHDLVGIDMLSIPFEEFFQFFNQKDLDKIIITCYYL
jgi:hypothetical protein